MTRNNGEGKKIVRNDAGRAYQEELFQNREALLSHSRYAKEKRTNALISDGEVEKLKTILESAQDKSVGQMSRNPYRQQLYAIIVGIAVSTRAAMEGGLNEEEAYTLSDIYIRGGGCVQYAGAALGAVCTHGA